LRDEYEGTKYNHVDICSLPNNSKIKSWNKITTINNTLDKHKAINKPKAAILIASSSFFGSIIANSYRPFAIDPNIEVIATNKANTPKSFGLYNLVKIGLIAIGIAWAIVVPVIRVKTLRENSDFGFILFNNYFTINQGFKRFSLLYLIESIDEIESIELIGKFWL
jgi:hypothetical protein